ncbi:MAG TPA: cytochrome c biogenesis protein CcdA [Roseiflexaceae bacterium]|nr:cytochrome c biogenesis protein CcdA [Roseiflexaceae bacterium]
MSSYLEAFVLGNAAILGNVCILPLYPSLLAFLAGQRSSRHVSGWLGVLVLAGILSLMIAIGMILYLLNQSFGALLGILLPLIYGTVLVLGILMLFGANPFERLSSIQAPLLKNPYATAYLYGIFLGPMTLPCTGPLIVSAFVLGAGNIASLADGLFYFLAFGLGFGWPLLLLPLAAQAFQQRFTGWLRRNYTLLGRASGLLLIGISLFGFWAEVLPQL